MADINKLLLALDKATEANNQDDVNTLAGLVDQEITPSQRELARTKNTVLGQYLRDKAKVPLPGETQQQTDERLYGKPLEPSYNVGKVEGSLRSLFQGQSYASGDELVAKAATLANRLFKIDPNKSYKEIYEQNLDRERGKLKQFERDNPVLAAGMEVTGALTSPANILLPFAGVKTVGQAVKRAIPTGFSQGALYGFGKGEEGLKNRAIKSGQYGAGGAAGGAVLAPITYGAGKGVQKLIENRAAKKTGLPPSVYNQLQNIVQTDPKVSRKNLDQLGDEAFLADSNIKTANTLDTLIQSGGEGSDEALKQISNRAARMNTELAKELDRVLGNLPDYKYRSRLNIYDKKVGKVYEEAYRTPIDYTRETAQNILQKIESRVPASIIKQANNLMRVEGTKSKQIKIALKEDGTIEFVTQPDTRQIDYITRALFSAARSDTDGPFGGMSTYGNALNNLSRSIRNDLKELNASYKNALQLASNNINQKNAKEFGSTILRANISRDEVADVIADMGNKEIQLASQGVRQYIDDILARVKLSMSDKSADGNVVKEGIKLVRELSSRENRDKLIILLGETKANTLFNKLDKTQAALNLQANVVTGSKTAARLIANEARKNFLDETPVGKLLEGRPIESAKDFLKMATGRTPADKEAAIDANSKLLLDALLQRGSDARQTLQNLQNIPKRVQPAMDFTNQLATALARRTPAPIEKSILDNERRKQEQQLQQFTR